MLTTALLCLALSQADADGGQAPKRTPASPDELARAIAKVKELPADQRPAALEEVRKKYGAAAVSPLLPPADVDLEKYRGLSEPDQAKVIARAFLTDLLSADTPAMISHCGLPFYLEDHRVDRVEDLRAEWAKNLRSKRTDLLTLFDIEVLTPADMEKKYGHGPNRLNVWNWRGATTLLAVANVNGRATVLMLRSVGSVWQVTGYHD